ncbi:hypothetical protein [uncultured Kiloniella sp.]|uniref:hypothetical protein n=1 Tax=uncultured Kiloniella sp. TaxID=1133091 RepID=UPI002626F0D6|nr:hypothetical protein [uncultured Kiloniella sp.]
MAHNTSSHEKEIRDAVVIKLRELFPSARIIHELNTGHGSNRVDLAAVTTSQIITAEIKSEKDTLKRLPRQVKQFKSCSHVTIVAAHAKFFETFSYFNNRDLGFRAKEPLAAVNALEWCYPIPDYIRYPHVWDIPASQYRNPDTREVLKLLWREELITESRKHGISVKTRDTKTDLMNAMYLHMTGLEISKAACRQLRQREFAEADPQIGAY